MSELEPMSEELGSEPTKIGQSNKAAEALPDKEASLQPDVNSAVAEKTKGSDEEEENGEKKKVPKPADIVNLFRFATAFDWLIILIGTLGAIAHGTALPLLMFYFGDLVNVLVNQNVTAQILANISGVCGNVSTCSMIFPNNACNFTLESLFPDTNSVGCLLDDQFINEINRLTFIFVGFGVGVFIAGYLQVSLFQMAAERQVHKIRLLFYRAILHQDIGWFDANPSGELSSRLSDDTEKIRAGIGDKLSIFIQWITTFVAGFVIAFTRDWRFTLLLLAFVPFLVITGAVVSKLVASFTNKAQKQYAGAGAVAEEVLSSIRTVAAFGGERREIQRYNGKLRDARRLGTKKGLSVGTSLGVIYFLLFFVYAVGFWFSGFLIAQLGVPGGSVLSAFFAVIIGAISLGQAAPNLENLMTAAGAAGAIFEVINRQPTIDSSSDEGLVPDKMESTIQFNNIHFNYPTRPDVKVLENFSLTVKPGQTVALVGPSGCGKSTVVQLLQRFYDVLEGEILVGGKDIRSLNLKWLRGNIGLVSQEPVLFDTTIAENIRYGKEGATMEEIEAAAKNANAHNFISELPNGYNTLVGEGGTQLSGGQKQRVAIARALVRDPTILLLDEATSALDTESESVVQSALDHAREGRTTIVIAHRLSTIQTADVIASIEDGQVVEMGTHEELMTNKGLYFDLVTAQSYGTDEVFIRGGLGRLHSMRGRYRSERGSESSAGALQHQASIERQTSIQRQTSVQQQTSIQRQTSVQRQASKLDTKMLEKRQEEWDKEIPSVPLTRVLAVNAKEWWMILLGVIGAALSGCLFPAFAIIFGEIFTVFALPADQIQDRINLYAGLMAVLGAAAAVGIFLKTAFFTISGENLTARLRSRSFKAMLRQEIGWYDDEKNSTGALTTRLAGDAAQVQGATGSRLGTLVETFIGMLFALVVAFVYSWLMTLMILAVVPILIVAGVLQIKALTGHATSNKKALEHAGKIAVDSIENARTVAALGVEENFFQQYKSSVKRPYRSALFHSVVYGLTYGFSQGFIYVMYGVVFRFGAFLVTQPEGSILHVEFNNVFRVFFALVFGALAVGQAGSFAPDYKKAKLSANRIFELLDRKPVIDGESEEGSKLEKVSGEITVNKVGFSYPARPDVKVLQGLSVSVKPGQTLALVGPSGCGKSTVVSLIERFYDPQNGSLALDGSDLRDLNLHWMRSQIGIVSQEPVLFDDTIAENIRYGALFREVSDEEVIEAAKAANIHSFIESLPQGYNTNVGAKGTQLSGGQKQRVAIARALVRDPKVLLLDEATSALDTESEKIVQEALDRAREGRTSIVIAHRLSTIYGSDCIAVIKDGKVVESGTHSELLAQKGIYFKLNRFQMISNEGAEEIELQ